MLLNRYAGAAVVGPLVDFRCLAVCSQYDLVVAGVASCLLGLAGLPVWVGRALGVVPYMCGPPAHQEALVGDMSSISLSAATVIYELALLEQLQPWPWLARGIV